jgi:hypothetical protein
VEGNLKLSDGMATGEVADSIPGKKEDGPGVPRYRAQLSESVALIA